MTLEDMWKVYYNKGLILFRKNDLTGALEALRKSIEFSMDNWKCYNLMGLCLYKIGKFTECKNVWKRSIEIYSQKDNPAVNYLNSMEEVSFKDICEKYNKAYNLSLNKDYKGALNTLSRTDVEKYPIVVIKNFCGLCSYAVGNKNKAIQEWKEVLKIDTSNKQALLYLSEVYEVKKESKGLLARLKELLITN